MFSTFWNKDHLVFIVYKTRNGRSPKKITLEPCGDTNVFCFFYSFNSQLRGTAILPNKNFEFKVKRYRKDNTGKKIILDIEFQGKRFTLTNVYGPNKDDPNFYQRIKEDIEYFNDENIIWTGDFNLLLDPKKD